MNPQNNGIWSKRKKVFFAGEMGTGKTEISINYSLQWSKNLGEKIDLIDLDMVKPYFRLRTIIKTLENTSVNVLAPPAPYGYADFPIIIPQVESSIRNLDIRTVVDVGGEDIGARLVGRYSGQIAKEDVDFLYVFNANRPQANDLLKLREMLSLIESAAGFPFTGIVNNTHLMKESTVEILESSIRKVEKFSELLQIPIRFHCIREDLYPLARKRIKADILPLKIYITPVWL